MSTAEIKKGETVIVYEDPLTETKPEGEFVPWKCFRITKFNSFRMEEWIGYFYGQDDMTVIRRIKVKEKYDSRDNKYIGWLSFSDS